jgi:hypothetical protein
MGIVTFSCVFSPQEGKRKTASEGKWEDPVTPSAVIRNMQVALINHDIDFYENCLHKDYYYLSPSEVDSLDIRWSRSEDVRIMKNMFGKCLRLDLRASYLSVEKEYGSNVEDIPEGASTSDEHKDQIWYKYNYDLTMYLNLQDLGEFQVQQFIQFVMVEEPKGQWSIIRWIDQNFSQ